MQLCNSTKHHSSICVSSVSDYTSVSRISANDSSEHDMKSHANAVRSSVSAEALEAGDNGALSSSLEDASGCELPVDP